jgi:hypothetical protein
MLFLILDPCAALLNPRGAAQLGMHLFGDDLRDALGPNQRSRVAAQRLFFEPQIRHTRARPER